MSAEQATEQEVALRRDLQSLAFRIGAGRKKWSLAKLEFPLVFVRIQAPQREGPSAFLLRIDCSGYPSAPTAVLFDGPGQVPLAEELKPKREDGGTVLAFTPSMGPCLYHPIDRMARGHWENHNDLAWQPGFTIVDLLETVHGLLATSEYVRSAAPEAAAYLPEESLGHAAE